MRIAYPKLRFRPLTLAVAILLAWALRLPAAQVPASEKVREVAANLASGRVTILVARDGIVVATVGKPFEPGDPAPFIIPLGEDSMAVALGAMDWVEPPANRPVLEIENELPRLIGGLSGSAPHLTSNANVAHLGQIGLGVLERLRAMAGELHARITLPENLPLAELIIVHRPAEEKGAVWDVSYFLKQRFLVEHFWNTEVDRPRYLQLFPIKDNRSGWVEISYPPNDSSPGLLEWLSQPSGRLAQDISSNPKLAGAQQEIAEGKGEELKVAVLGALAKLALDDMAPASSAKALAAIDSQRGFAWIIQPSPSPAELQRRPGAPTLETHP